MRPPSRGETGRRLMRLRKNPVNASAIRNSESYASPAIQTAAAPMLPRIGPPTASLASAHAFGKASFGMIAAPRNGMKIGALTRMPCRFASSTWPISWTNMRSTNPTANGQPQNSV